MDANKTISTTFGQFIEWYISWRYDNGRIMQANDVTAKLLKERLSCYVDGTFDDEGSKFDRFFGLGGRVFGGSYCRVARYIRDHFNTRIELTEYSDGHTPWVQFNIGGQEFDMCTGLHFGEYEYKNANGFPIK